MSKKVKLLYIDKHKITRDFFDLCLKDTHFELVSLEDLSTFSHNYEEFRPNLVLLDAKTLSVEPSFDSLADHLKKSPGIFVICGKIDEIDSIELEVKHQFLKPYSPHELALQLSTFLDGGDDKEVH